MALIRKIFHERYFAYYSLKEQRLARWILLLLRIRFHSQNLRVINKTNFTCKVNYPNLPCRIYIKNEHDKNKDVQCDIWEFSILIKCSNLNYLDYKYLQNYDESWYCIECCSTIFPFNVLSSNKNFLSSCSSSDIDSNFMQLRELKMIIMAHYY